MNVNFIKVAAKRNLEEKLNNNSNPSLAGVICFIENMEDEFNSSGLAIFNEDGVVKYIQGSSVSNGDEPSISLNDYLKLNENKSLYLNFENSKENIVKAINLNSLENKVNREKEHLSFSAGEGVSQEIGTISMGANYSLSKEYHLNPIQINQGSPANVEYLNEDDNQAQIFPSEQGAEIEETSNENSNTSYSLTNFICLDNSLTSDDIQNYKNKNAILINANNDYYLTSINDILIPSNNNGIQFNFNNSIPWSLDSESIIKLIVITEINPSIAKHSGSIAIGQGVESTCKNGFFLGKFNKIIDGNNYGSNLAFAIGSGTKDNRRTSVEITNSGIINLIGPNGQEILKIDSSDNQQDRIIIPNFEKLGIITNNTYKSLDTYISEKAKQVSQELPSIYNQMSPIIVGPPSSIPSDKDQEILNWINSIYQSHNKGCLWLDTRIGNGVLKRRIDTNGVIQWIPISSAYT